MQKKRAAGITRIHLFFNLMHIAKLNPLFIQIRKGRQMWKGSPGGSFLIKAPSLTSKGNKMILVESQEINPTNGF
jgi:hypothetical protein